MKKSDYKKGEPLCPQRTMKNFIMKFSPLCPANTRQRKEFFGDHAKGDDQENLGGLSQGFVRVAARLRWLAHLEADWRRRRRVCTTTPRELGRRASYDGETGGRILVGRKRHETPRVSFLLGTKYNDEADNDHTVGSGPSTESSAYTYNGPVGETITVLVWSGREDEERARGSGGPKGVGDIDKANDKLKGIIIESGEPPQAQSIG